MTLADLLRYDLIYLATPYTKYERGIKRAYIDACKLTGRLIQLGLKVYSPIAHTHPVAIHGGIDPLDHGIWLPFNSSLVAKSDALLVGMLSGWRESFGVQKEIGDFADRPTFYLNPVTLQIGEKS